MKICQVSKADSFGGGASRVAEELTQLLIEEGYGAEHWVSWTGAGYNEYRRPLYGSIERTIRRAHIGAKMFLSMPEVIPFELPIFLRNDRWKRFDLFHFHDLSSAISPLTLHMLSRRRPVVWTIHDCSPFTGGCLYPMECGRFRTSCGSCPQIGQWPIDAALDLTRLWRAVKRHVHKSGRITLVTPSQWMADFAMSSGMLKERPIVIPNGVDIKRYRPGNKAALRQEFGLAEERTVVLLSAGHVKDPRKGIRFALDALRTVVDLKPVILLVGAVDETARTMLAGFDIIETGYVGDPTKLARAYAASDLLLFCSLAENMPLTILEAMACGVPLVGFAAGGVPELIVQNETGLTVPPENEGELNQALRWALSAGKLADWGRAARARAESCYSHDKLLSAHEALYEQIILARFGAWTEPAMDPRCS